MATRVGIELSPAFCRIVELDEDSCRHGNDRRVRSFSMLPLASHATLNVLSAYSGRRASVVVWGVRNDQGQAAVSVGPQSRMRGEALAAIRPRMGAAGVVGRRRLLVDVAPAGPPVGGRQRLALTAAASDDVRSVLMPLAQAGVRIGSVMTPAVGLMSLARTRRALAVPDAAEVYIALEETATCLALINQGVVAASRELPWGYLDGSARELRPRSRDEVATQLSDHLALFLKDVGRMAGRVAQVCICGGAPELRTLTLPLMERFDVEVEPLDSLAGIDAERLPEPADRFRESVASLRLAWAVAAEIDAPLDLMRDLRRRAVRAALSRAAVAAGIVAGVGAGWGIAQSAWWASAPATSLPSTRALAAPSRRQGTPPVLPLPARQGSPAPATPPTDVLLAAAGPPASAPPVSKPLAAAEFGQRSRSRTAELVPRIRSAAATSRNPTVSASRLSVARGSEPEPTRFDAVLGTILYSADRRAAIIDGRVVEPGDEIRGARVLDITTRAVFLRDTQGRLRQLTLAASSR